MLSSHSPAKLGKWGICDIIAGGTLDNCLKVFRDAVQLVGRKPF